MQERLPLATREDYEQSELARVAGYGLAAARSRGRLVPDEEDPFRSIFQTDRDRVVQTTAFRRLQYKTQVFVNHEGDYYRSRLTHTIEAAMVTRTIAGALRVNPDLAEVITLAHDLGHPPFGHSGEDALNELMTGHGGFEHNAHSLRIVDVLEERYPGFRGLNLNFEVREGIIKHSTDYDRGDASGFEPEKQPSIEAQISSVADQITYNSHDLDDGLRAGLLDLDSLEEVTLWREARAAAETIVGRNNRDVLRHQIIRNVRDSLMHDLIEGTAAMIARHRLQTTEDVRDAGEWVVRFSPEMDARNRQLVAYLYRCMYNQFRVIRMAAKATRVLRDLFNTYLEWPQQLPPNVYARAESEAIARVVCDYIAGMTDRFALDEYAKLFDPHQRV